MTVGLSALFAWLPFLLTDYRHLRSGVFALLGFFGIGSLLLGFYPGILFPGTLAYQLVIGVSSFVALAFFKANLPFLTFAFSLLFACPIGQQGGEMSHSIGNERLLAEFLGILLARFAIQALVWLQSDSDS